MTEGSSTDFGGGVFVSSLATEDFAPDPDVPGTEQHVLYADGDLSAGMSRVAIEGVWSHVREVHVVWPPPCPRQA
jgi:hypothetical protein